MLNSAQRKVSLSGLMTSAGFIAGLLTIAGFLGRFYWRFDVVANFPIQYAIALLITAILLYKDKKRLWSAVSLILAMINLIIIVPFLPVKQNTKSNDSFRVMLINVNTSSGKPEKVVKLIKRLSPDTVVLEEVDGNWISAIKAVSNDYPFQITAPRDDNFGIALLSRVPIRNQKILKQGFADIPTVYAELETNSVTYKIIGTHPLPPASSEYAKDMHSHLDELANLIPKIGGNIILVGDLNNTPWTYRFRRFTRNSGLKNASSWHGINPSWPSFAGPFGIPIDHCLYRGDIQPISIFKAGNTGSDHSSIIADFTAK